MASASDVKAGRAYVELGVDSKALAKGLNAAAAKLKAFGAGVSNIGKAFMAAGTAITAPLTLMAKGFADSGTRMLQMSQRTGVSVEALSQLGYAAERSGVDMETLENGLRKMQRTVFAAATGSQAAQEALGLLGLNIKQLANMSPEEQFKAIADGLAGIQDPTLRAALAMQVLGRGGTALLPMMENGARGIEQLEQKAQGLGLTMSTESAQSAKALSLSLADMGSVTRKTSSILGSALADTLRQTAQRITTLVVKLNDFIKSHKDVVVAAFKVARTVFAVGVGLVVLGTIIGRIGAGFGILATIVTQASAFLGLMGSILVWLVSPIGLVITAMAALGAYLLYSTGAGAKALAWLGEKFGALKDDALAAWQGIGDALAAGDIGLAARILWLTLKMEWTKGIAALQPLWLGFKMFFIKVAYGAFYGAQAAWEIVQHGLTVAWIETTSFLSKTWTNFSSTVESAWESTQGYLADKWLDLMSLFDKSFDKDAAKKLNQQQTQSNLSQIEQSKQSELDRIEQERSGKRKAETDQHEAELGQIGKDYEDAIGQAASENDQKIQSAQDDIAKAKAEWQAAMEQAKQKRAAKDAEDKGPGKMEGPPKLHTGLNLGDLLDQAKERTIGVHGTFNAMEARGMAAGGVSDRIAKASEHTANNTKKILDELRQNGAEFD